ncbi:MAG TPA: SDR family NAD(P)-dependent oxidoreductase [Chloroflexia bacterium]|nr:SDR family NAD(P)-dependent oxidoreductase [Chloroflexia bacterium]
MQDFQGKVAVITGGASGIGFALAEKCVAEGMKVVLADVESGALEKAVQALKEQGADVTGVKTDVSKSEQVEALADKAYEAYGEVHLLFNNAGVGGGGLTWEESLHDWEWVLGVDLWGVIYGVRSFVPRMLKQNSEGHIVNTASMAGLVSPPAMGSYNVAKHGVLALSETLYQELALVGSKLKTSVLCPSWVNTRINESGRNRPGGENTEALSQPSQMVQQFVQQAVQSGISANEVAEKVFEAIRTEKFYILTHPDSKPAIKHQMDALLNDRNPANLLGRS